MKIDYKKSSAARTTETRDIDSLIEQVDGNIFEVIAMLSKRSNQIGSEIKEELLNKLEEFATKQDNLEEIFENREQIEISRFYEKLPKPHSIAVEELLNGKLYYRYPEEN